MADKTSLIITADDFTTGKAQQKTVTDINPNASSSHLRTWAQMTTGLTKDTYKKAKRIDVTDLDVTKPTLVIEFRRGEGDWLSGDEPFQVPLSEINSNNQFTFTAHYSGGTSSRANIDFPTPSSTDFPNASCSQVSIFNSRTSTFTIYLGTKKAGSLTIPMCFRGDDQYETFRKTLTFNIVEE